MKYELIGSNNYHEDIINEIFKNRGIKNYEEVLSVSKDAELDYNLLDNIDEAVECLIEHLDNKDDILVVVDSDTDGNTSAAMLINYINLIYENSRISWVVHDKKQHGLSDIQVYGNIKLVIIPDAGSNDYEYHKNLKERGIDCIILDHHMCERYSTDAIVVNNQMSKNYPNKQLSGVGVTYKFIQALDEIVWKDYSFGFLDLVSLGNIADSMNLSNLETRYYVKEGLNCVTNPFILALMDKQRFSLGDNVTITGIMFYIAPLINAMIRVGSYKEKEEMFKAFLGNNDLVTYKSRGVDKEDFFSNYVARNCVNTKARQKREVDKLINKLNTIIKENKYYEDNIIVIDGSVILDDKNGGLTGLIATKIAEEYHKPTILLHGKEILNGSARGYGGEFDFKDIVNGTKLVEFAEGHQFAFGVSIKRECLTQFKESLNDKLKNYIGEKVYNVDFILQPSDITYELVDNIYSLKNEYCKGIEEPLLCIENIEIPIENVKLMGKNKNTIKIETEEVSYVKFFTNEDRYNEIINKNINGILRFNIIGKASMNEYNGNCIPQIIIEDYEVLN
ncbi:DHH family phosphoesterase [Clostridium sp.]|uniref:DHH family phosphoesterase n=1 Tax=Clostridium sp. TaxID=1506 RepID=UPI0025856454|nr:DHH family phosphoesterase [Clostridium sp.]MDF2503876.1 hypothetical protein [Clostridium sp.]